MEDLTAFQRDMLYIIADLDAPKGLKIKEKYDEYYNEKVHHGRLYPNLDALVEKGLVEKGSHDDRTNSYTLTPRALRNIEARRKWENQHINGEEVPDLQKSANQ